SPRSPRAVIREIGARPEPNVGARDECTGMVAAACGAREEDTMDRSKSRGRQRFPQHALRVVVAVLGAAALSACGDLADDESESSDRNAPALTTGQSALWGASGELWSPISRLPDTSYAGYRTGEKAIPNVPQATSVKAYGAVGDGVHDDTN